ncbi:MAG TPA: DsrE family protein [Pseudohaliea sp.]|nr:DsrE family protein [Pseudohaliea sp.]
MKRHTLALTIGLACIPAIAVAGPEAFSTGPLIKDYGMIAEVPQAALPPADARFKVAIDVVEGGIDGELNGKFQTAASLINLLNASGVAAGHIEVALVVHGPAYRDLLVDRAYGGDNPNAELIAALQANGATLYYCGQSAVYRDVAGDDLLPGIDVTLSATITHAMLQQQGYALRP